MLLLVCHAPGAALATIRIMGEYSSDDSVKGLGIVAAEAEKRIEEILKEPGI